MTMSCLDREGGLADFFEGEGGQATPRLALARFLESHSAFDQMTVSDEILGPDTAKWSFVDSHGATVAEVNADRINGSWGVVGWMYCRA